MADEADAANEQADKFLAEALRKRHPELVRTLVCRAPGCGEALSDTRALFCNAECRDAWEAHSTQHGLTRLYRR